jgi:hypothetical protein
MARRVDDRICRKEIEQPRKLRVYSVFRSVVLLIEDSDGSLGSGLDPPLRDQRYGSTHYAAVDLPCKGSGRRKSPSEPSAPG